MKLVADSKDFSSDKRALGFTLLLCLSIPLMFAPIYLLVAPSVLGIPAPAALAILLGGLALMLFLGVFLKGRGILFKVPLRVFEEGLLIQPAVGLRPFLVPYSDISAVELFYGAEGKVKNGCMVLSGQYGKIKSVENFTDAMALKSFTMAIEPFLMRNSFKMEINEEKGLTARFVFRRGSDRSGF
ncbi:MAG: hypothetical protein V1861_00500 [Candidatus Micrarchaeota archaeon]